MVKQFFVGLVVWAFATAALAQTPPVCPRSTDIVVAWDAATVLPGQQTPAFTHVFRRASDCSNESVPFSEVHVGPANVLTFNDTSVVPGNTYCYVAFNESSTGVMSGPSNPAHCSVPQPQLTPPAAPENLRLVRSEDFVG